MKNIKKLICIVLSLILVLSTISLIPMSTFAGDFDFNGCQHKLGTPKPKDDDTHTISCTRSGCDYSETEDCSFDSFDIQATCQTQGYTYHSCICGNVYYDNFVDIDEEAHEWGYYNGIGICKLEMDDLDNCTICEHNGQTSGTCSTCGYEFEQDCIHCAGGKVCLTHRQKTHSDVFSFLCPSKCESTTDGYCDTHQSVLSETCSYCSGTGRVATHNHDPQCISPKRSCTEYGTDVEIYQCRDCAEYFYDEYGLYEMSTDEYSEHMATEGGAYDHDWSNFDGICKNDPTHKCKHSSVISGNCTICGKDMTEHTYGSWKSDGKGSHTRSCTDNGCLACETADCDYTTNSVGATCKSYAYTEYTCKDCNYSYKQYDTDGGYAAHQYENWYTNNNGTHSRKCPVCEKTETIDCTYSSKKTNPTCAEKGYTEYTCDTCNHSYKGDYVDATGTHEFTIQVTPQINSSCTEDGSTALMKCANCKETTGGETIPAKGHKVASSNNAVAPTCTKAGKQADTYCSECGETLANGSTIDATGHTEVSSNNGIAATCTTSGKMADTYCSECYETITTGALIKPIGHKYTTKNVAPTYAAKGYTLHTCSNCGYSYKDTYKAKKTVAKPSITTISSPKSKQIKVNWSKKSYTGYQVQIATDSKFTKSKKTAKITNYKTVTKTFTKLKGEKKYYVRVRAYKTYKGKTYYSSWSTVKTIKTKK